MRRVGASDSERGAVLGTLPLPRPCITATGCAGLERAPPDSTSWTPCSSGGRAHDTPHLASSCCRWFPPSLRRHRRARPQPASPPPFWAHQRCGNGGGMGRGGRSLSSSPRFLFFFLFSLWFCCCCLWKRRPACSKQPYLCFYLGTNVGCVSARACACVRACFLVLGFLKKWEEEKKKRLLPFPGPTSDDATLNPVPPFFSFLSGLVWFGYIPVGNP